ncbi:hypothetical protein ACFQX7_19740 [Luedemannella flava]
MSRPSELTELLGRHGTRAAAAYFLRERGRSLDEVDARHEALQAALAGVGAAIPADWRRGHVSRADLPRFLFAPEDVVIAVGQDGLVANVAKYLSGQPVIGVDPEPDRNPGVLVRHAAGSVAPLLRAAVAGRAGVQARTMVAACLDDGQELLGLNEIYFGHATHQSSRYRCATPRRATNATRRPASSSVRARARPAGRTRSRGSGPTHRRCPTRTRRRCAGSSGRRGRRRGRGCGSRPVSSAPGRSWS